MQFLLNSVLTFLASNMDEILVYVLLLAKFKKESEQKKVVLGILLGNLLILLLSFIVSRFLSEFVPQAYLGFLGLVPIFIGIKFAVKGEDDEKEEMEENFQGDKSLIWATSLIMFTLNVDDLSLYIPYFSSLSLGELLFTMAFFMLATGILIFLSQKLTSVSMIQEGLEKVERILLPVIFVFIGIQIFWKMGTIDLLLR